MKCSGKCYCGKDCDNDHEVVERRCSCNGSHNICQDKCDCGKQCVCIAKHKANHECLIHFAL